MIFILQLDLPDFLFSPRAFLFLWSRSIPYYIKVIVSVSFRQQIRFQVGLAIPVIDKVVVSLQILSPQVFQLVRFFLSFRT